MPIAQSFLAEFDHELATTRTVLERVPESQAAWKPHPRSMSLSQLATHLAEVPKWTGATLTQTGFDVAPVGGPPYTPPAFAGMKALLGEFAATGAAARAALIATPDADFLVDWSLLKGGQVQFTMPRVAVFRTFVLNHLIHHRGQLSVYLRLLDVPVPSIYGPTADVAM